MGTTGGECRVKELRRRMGAETRQFPNVLAPCKSESILRIHLLCWKDARRRPSRRGEDSMRPTIRREEGGSSSTGQVIPQGKYTFFLMFSELKYSVSWCIPAYRLFLDAAPNLLSYK